MFIETAFCVDVVDCTMIDSALSVATLTERGKALLQEQVLRVIAVKHCYTFFPNSEQKQILPRGTLVRMGAFIHSFFVFFGELVPLCQKDITAG